MNPVQAAILYLVVAVWCGCVGEPATRLWLASRRRPAVQRARLRALSAGYAGIVGLLVFALAASALAANPSSTGVVVGTDLLALAVVPLLSLPAPSYPYPRLRLLLVRSVEALRRPSP